MGSAAPGCQKPGDLGQVAEPGDLRQNQTTRQPERMTWSAWLGELKPEL